MILRPHKRLRIKVVFMVGLLLGSFHACSPPPIPVTKPCAESCPAETSECVEGKFCLTKCAAGTKRCGLLCADLQRDQRHCGACGTACKFNEICSAGTCTALSDCQRDPSLCPKSCPTACTGGKSCIGGACLCPVGENDCNGTCANLSSSPIHCGLCGNKCPQGSTCTQGKCACPSGLVLCNGACISTKDNDKHCGACGNACGTGRFCDVNSCACGAGKTDCGGVCVDNKSDPNHCGACGTACARKQSCQEGKCLCPKGEQFCGGKCISNNDAAHCGACDNACKATEICLAGKCTARPKCTNGKADCSGSCVDLNTDAKHCGACGNPCKSNEACDNGKCKVQSCAKNEVKCGTICANLTNHASHCGACNRFCLGTERCFESKCVPICTSDKTLCGNKCIDLKTDLQHCGSCGKACPLGNRCNNGTCQSLCSGKLTSCPSGCVDLQADPANCGKCGTKCAACQSGKCLCQADQINCNNTCIDFLKDAANCGSCNKACAKGQVCTLGKCTADQKIWYYDRDGDGFGDKNAPLRQAANLPAPKGFVANNTDCCDRDRDAKPGQTKYFNYPTACGGYDYNCDKKESLQTDLCTCSTSMRFTHENVKIYGQWIETTRGGFRHRHDFKETPAFTQARAIPTQPTCTMEKVSDIRFTSPKSLTINYGWCNSSPLNVVGGPFSGDAVVRNKNLVMWKAVDYKAGCVFAIDGKAPACGSTKVRKAGATKYPRLGIGSGFYTGRPQNMGRSICVSCNCMNIEYGVHGSITIGSGFVVSNISSEPAPPVKCR